MLFWSAALGAQESLCVMHNSCWLQPRLAFFSSFSLGKWLQCFSTPCQLFEAGNFSQCLWKDESHHSMSVSGFCESGVELMSPTQGCSAEEVALLHRLLTLGVV